MAWRQTNCHQIGHIVTSVAPHNHGILVLERLTRTPSQNNFPFHYRCIDAYDAQHPLPPYPLSFLNSLTMANIQQWRYVECECNDCRDEDLDDAASMRT